MHGAIVRADENAFLREITAAPGDDAPRLAYAEWLERLGDQRAEFLRVQCAWDGAAPGEDTYWELGSKEFKLRSKVESDWLDRLEGVTDHSSREIWEKCVTDPNCFETPAGRKMARRSSRNLMRRARKNVESLVARLSVSGYDSRTLSAPISRPRRIG